ncbi:MAG: hypothetical protein IPH20_21135 [Bacteroidales bacterium]|nr:hypothetical protein [Bacteroidales bacterium]
MNNKLEEPNNFKIPEQKKGYSKGLDDSKKNLKEGQMKKASKSQDDAADKMERWAMNFSRCNGNGRGRVGRGH